MEVNSKTLSKKLKIEEEIRKKMKTTPEYIKWIEKFTETHDGFSDRSFDYNNNISSEDLEQVKLLSIFYSIISDWAEKNYIEDENPNVYTFFFNIQYNGILYEIGLNVGQGGENWVSRIESPNSEIIHFEEVMMDHKRLEATLLENTLEELGKYIIKLRENGISEQLIKHEVEKSLDACIEKKGVQKVIK